MEQVVLFSKTEYFLIVLFLFFISPLVYLCGYIHVSALRKNIAPMTNWAIAMFSTVDLRL